MSDDFAARLAGLPRRSSSRRRGETFFRAGDEVREMLVVVSGCVELVRHAPTGERITL